MTDAILSTPVTLNRPDGTSLTFKKCSPADRITFRAIFRQYRKVWLAQSLAALDITGDAAVERMNKLDKQRLVEWDVLQWVLEPEGQNEAILLSMKIDNPKAEMKDVYALNLDDNERLQVAIGVFDLVLEQKAEAKEAQNPLASGGIGIGAATEVSSPTSPEPPTPSDSPSTSSNAA